MANATERWRLRGGTGALPVEVAVELVQEPGDSALSAAGLSPREFPGVAPADPLELRFLGGVGLGLGAHVLERLSTLLARMTEAGGSRCGGAGQGAAHEVLTHAAGFAVAGVSLADHLGPRRLLQLGQDLATA